MAERHDLQVASLMRFGHALSELNDKLFHAAIEQLFSAKPAEVVQQHIEGVAMAALERMQCPKEHALQKFTAHRLHVRYGDGSGAGDGGTSSVRQKQTPEMEALDAEIEKLQSENAELVAQRDGAQNQINVMLQKARAIAEGMAALAAQDLPFEEVWTSMCALSF